ncbi:MAG: hypothetical protein AAF798_15230 [Bacteroidota bacterium]
MNAKERMNQLLLKSLDLPLSAEEQTALDQALEASAALREDQAKLLAMRQLLAKAQLEASPSFADRVMDTIKLRQRPTFTASIIRLYPKVAAACILLLLAGMLGIYLSEGNLSVDALVGVQELSIDEAYTLVDY